jgi:hypothetical protein
MYFQFAFRVGEEEAEEWMVGYGLCHAVGIPVAICHRANGFAPVYPREPQQRCQHSQAPPDDDPAEMQNFCAVSTAALSLQAELYCDSAVSILSTWTCAIHISKLSLPAASIVAGPALVL